MSVSSFGLAESNRFDQFDHLIRRFPEPRHERPTHQHALAPSSDKRVVTKPSVFRLLVISTEELPACDLESVRFRRNLRVKFGRLVAHRVGRVFLGRPGVLTGVIGDQN